MAPLARLVVGLQAYHPAAASREGLKANVARALELGARQLSYYNYGNMPRPNLEWIKYCTQAAKAG